jgi:hypothetical protein
MKKIFLFLFLFQVGVCMAQDKYYYVTLDVNTPLSNTAWISSTTAKGLKAGVRQFINEKFSAGVDFGFSTFNQYVPTETTNTGTGTITTDYFRYIYNYSLVASGQYNFHVGNGETFFPYAGIGLGANNNEYVLYYNAYTDTDSRWGFVARPEAGMLIKFTKRRDLGAMLAIHYDYSTNKSKVFDYSSFSTIGFQVGLMFMRM